jgi:indolepyruvate ferredoxin oxidoreductase beta subunit
LRFYNEQQRIDRWLKCVRNLAQKHLDCAYEVTLCQSLIKGYGATHERGLRNFETIFSTLDEEKVNAGTALRIARLRHAALADEHGDQLRETLQHVA